MIKIRLKEKWIDGNLESIFICGSNRGDEFFFISKDGERHDGIMLSNDKGVLNIPGGIRFDALFENPTSLKGERREVTKEFMEVTIS